MISVCMTTYNGEKFIFKQLKSILLQLDWNDEVIVSDDGSTDDTLSIIKDFNDPRIKVFRFNSPVRIDNYHNDKDFKRNRLIKNFENALTKANGDIIFLSDQDDIWYNMKVCEVVRALKFSDLVVTDCSIIDENDKVLVDSRFKIKKPKKNFFNALMKNPYLGCTMAFKKVILSKAIPFPSNIPMHDIWIGMVANVFFSTTLLDKSLVGYRRHEYNMNNHQQSKSYLKRRNVSQYSFIKRLRFRLKIINELFKLLIIR